MEKKELRQKYFAAVKSLSSDQKAAASGNICQQLKSLDRFRGAEAVFAFLPLPSEPDLRYLFQSTPEKTWAFPRVLGDALEFRAVRDLGETRQGEWKIEEPDPARCPLVMPNKRSIVLVPGVAFNPETGDRLGRGKGHYDRYLGPFRTGRSVNSPFVIGVCFSVQIAEWIAEAHDIPMDLVVYEKGI